MHGSWDYIQKFKDDLSWKTKHLISAILAGIVRAPTVIKLGSLLYTKGPELYLPWYSPRAGKLSIRDPVFWNIRCRTIGVLTHLTQETIEPLITAGYTDCKSVAAAKSTRICSTCLLGVGACYLPSEP